VDDDDRDDAHPPSCAVVFVALVALVVVVGGVEVHGEERLPAVASSSDVSDVAGDAVDDSTWSGGTCDHDVVIVSS